MQPVLAALSQSPSLASVLASSLVGGAAANNADQRPLLPLPPNPINSGYLNTIGLADLALKWHLEMG